MPNVNLDAYWEAISIQNKNPNILKRWHSKSFRKFAKKYEKQFEIHRDLWLYTYDNNSLFDGRSEKLNKIDKEFHPKNLHKIQYFFVDIPLKIHSWIICGFKLKRYDKEHKNKVSKENYHLLDKLCRYETWPDVKITLWDKIRFKIITGKKFVS